MGAECRQRYRKADQDPVPLTEACKYGQQGHQLSDQMCPRKPTKSVALRAHPSWFLHISILFEEYGSPLSWHRPLVCKIRLKWAKNSAHKGLSCTWIVALFPSRRIISPMSLSWPTRINSYMAAPPMLSATTTGPDTFLTYLQRSHVESAGLSSSAQSTDNLCRVGLHVFQRPSRTGSLLNYAYCNLWNV